MAEVSLDMQEESWFLVANWKMNKTIRQAEEFVERIMPQINTLKYPLWIGAPFTALHSLQEMKKKYTFILGAQNMNDASEGAFTGEIAAPMLRDVGAQFVILGHSERRLSFHETDEYIARKVARAVMSQLVPILCVGETLEEKKENQTLNVLKKQLEAVFEKACPQGLKKMLIAYEPVWAIGTGLSASNEDIEKALSHIGTLSSQYNVESKVLYGGSVGQKNAESLASIAHLNGFLVGTAALEADSFAKIALISENRHFQS